VGYDAMGKMLARPILWLLTTAIPVVIAACYGALESFRLWGNVVDRETGEGINNIKVSCILSNGPTEWSVEETQSSESSYYGDGGVGAGDETHSMPEDGYFSIGYDEPCYKLRFEDVDGEANGGRYATRVIKYDGGNGLLVELDRED
jgi:hypothetical protein